MNREQAEKLKLLAGELALDIKTGEDLRHHDDLPQAGT